MIDSDPSSAQAHACAEQIFDLLPLLRRYVTSRVSHAGVDIGLSLRQYAALRGIRDGASSPGELARLWQVTPAVITGIVDRLERRELVRREPDSEDRRRLRLVLTDAGLQASDVVERALTGDLAAQLESTPHDELSRLVRALDLLQRTLADLEERMPGSSAYCSEDHMPIWDDDSPDDGGGRSATTERSITRRAAAGAAAIPPPR